MPGVKKVLLWLVLVLLIIGILSLFYADKDTPEAKPTYNMGEIIKGDLQLSVSATGTVKPLTTVQIGSQVSGTLEKVFVDFNSHVKKGDVIAQIEPSLFKAKVAQARANYNTAIAEKEKAWVTVEEAKRELNRAKDLAKSNMITESEVDNARYQYNQAFVEHKVKLAAIDLALASLKQTEVNLAHTTIKAPINGVVLSRDVDIGQTVAASLQAPILFTIAQDLRLMQLETDVDEAFIGMINEGQTVSFTVFAYPNKRFTGKLVQIRLNPRLETDVVLYNSIIHVKNDDLSLKPGMTATVTIDIDHRKNILKIPNAALRYRPKMPPEKLKKIQENLKVGKHEALIWKLLETGPKPIKVTLGLAADKETEISAEEVSEGMKIILFEKRKKIKRQTGIKLF